MDDMARRQTDTDKWKGKWFRSLDPIHKLFWLYINDECDHAGIWHVDFEVASLRIGDQLIEEEIQSVFLDKIKVFDESSKWMILPFLDEQYPGGLKEENRVHKSVIEKLQRYGLYPQSGNNNDQVNYPVKGLSSPVTAPSNGAIDIDKDKDKEIKINSKRLEIYKNLCPFIENETVKIAWSKFQEMRKKIKKPMTDHAEELALKKLVKLSNSDIDTAVTILEKSIFSSWSDLYAIDNGSTKQFYKSNQSQERNAHSGGKKTFS